MRRRPIPLLALPAGLAAGLLAACQPAPPDPRGVARDETLLTVSATGRAEASPDEARFTLGVVTIGPNAREASRLNGEKMTRILAALRGFGVADKDIQTRDVALGRIEYGRERGQYRAANNVEVRFAAVPRVGEAITAVTEAGANLVGGPSLSVSDREGASRSAYAAAYKAARARADAYAEAAGLKVARVLTIRDGGERGGSERYATVDSAMMAEQTAPPPVAAPPFNPGTNRTTVAVAVSFALEEN